MSGVAVSVDGVGKAFRLYRERNDSLKLSVLRGRRATYDRYWALQDVTCTIPTGSVFGIVGNNGAGKSTLLKCIARILRPDRGEIRRFGSVAALLELGAGFHPDLTGRENVYLNGALLGLSKRAISSRFAEIAEFAEVGHFIDQPVKTYSSGMYLRLAFSVAVNVDPDILLVDELIMVGDATFHDRCLDKFAEFHRRGKTVVIVTHALGLVSSLCDEAIWLHDGLAAAQGPAAGVVDMYRAAIDPTQSSPPAPVATPVLADSPVQLRGVELVGSDGRQLHQLTSGEPATIRAHYETTASIDRPVVVLVIDSATGERVWAAHSRGSEGVPECLDGTGHIDFRIPRLALQGGRYALHAVLWNHTMTAVLATSIGGATFAVTPVALGEFSGFAALGGDWDCMPARESIVLVGHRDR